MIGGFFKIEIKFDHFAEDFLLHLHLIVDVSKPNTNEFISKIKKYWENTSICAHNQFKESKIDSNHRQLE